MDKIKEKAFEILDVSQKIYQKQENVNPSAIFKGKVFIIGTEEDCEAVSVQQNYERKDGSYYFESPDINGVIIKRERGNYCVKASVKYTDASDQSLWFAKIRIENPCAGDVQIMGLWGGSWEQPDCDDENLILTPDSDFPIALDSMKNNLVDIYEQLCKDNGANDESFEPKWVKQLKKYNN